MYRFFTNIYELMIMPVKATSNSINNMLTFGSSIIIVPYNSINNVITKQDIQDDVPNMVPNSRRFFMITIVSIEDINKLRIRKKYAKYLLFLAHLSAMSDLRAALLGGFVFKDYARVTDFQRISHAANEIAVRERKT